jgi:hypothetical protein
MSGQLVQYHVSRGGETLGPFTFEQIAQMLAANSLAVTDFVWDASVQDWILILQFAQRPEMASLLMARKPKAPVLPSSQMSSESLHNPTAHIPTSHKPTSTENAGGSNNSNKSTGASATGSAEKLNLAAVQVVAMEGGLAESDAIEWFVMRGQQRFGPFTYLGVVRALQDKSVFEFDHVWKAGMERWVRIAEHEEFNAIAMRELMRRQEARDAFAKRQHQRVRLENNVLVHDQRQVSPARMYEASRGGSGLLIQNATLMPGQIVNLHFSAVDRLPAFAAKGEIVSKKFTPFVRDARTPVFYGVKFVQLEPKAEAQIQAYFAKLGESSGGGPAKRAAGGG